MRISSNSFGPLTKPRMKKIKIEMSRHDWVAAEHILWRCIRNGRDRMIQEYLLKAYDKNKMLIIDPDKNKHWNLEPHIGAVVATQIEWFLRMVIQMNDKEAFAFANEFRGNLNRIASEIRRQQIR